MSDPHDPHALSRRTTPTWEVELLISGVAVFAMLQLPGWLDDGMFALEPRLASEWRVVVLLAYFYAKSAAVILAATFALHLLLRAQWIALVGMHSVYPDGVRLDRLRMGPLQREIETGRHQSAAEAIERADNRASVIFAIGVSVAVIIGFVCVVFCGALLLATVVSQAAGWHVDPLHLLTWVAVLVVLPFFAAGLADQLFGRRLARDGRAHRALAAILRVYTRAGMGRLNPRVLATLASNGPGAGITMLVAGVMLAAIAGVSAGYIAMQRPASIGSYGLFPTHAGNRIEYEFKISNNEVELVHDRYKLKRTGPLPK